MPSSSGKKKAGTKAANKNYVDAGVRKELQKVDWKGVKKIMAHKAGASEGPKKRKPAPKVTSSQRKSR